jgi:hypothetical protein
MRKFRFVSGLFLAIRAHVMAGIGAVIGSMAKTLLGRTNSLVHELSSSFLQVKSNHFVESSPDTGKCIPSLRNGDRPLAKAAGVSRGTVNAAKRGGRVWKSTAARLWRAYQIPKANVNLAKNECRVHLLQCPGAELLRSSLRRSLSHGRSDAQVGGNSADHYPSG